MKELMRSDLEILTLLSEGLSGAEICKQVGISEAAFKKALKRIEARADSESQTVGTLLQKALRIKGENSLRSLEARFQALMSILPGAVLVVDGRTGLIKEVNESACQLFGFSVQEFIGRSVEDLVPDEYRAVHPQYRLGFLSSVRKRELGYHPPIFGVKADGSSVEVSIALTATTADNDVMVVCTDKASWMGAERVTQKAARSL